MSHWTTPAAGFQVDSASMIRQLIGETELETYAYGGTKMPPIEFGAQWCENALICAYNFMSWNTTTSWVNADGTYAVDPVVWNVKPALMDPSDPPVLFMNGDTDPKG